MKNTKLRYLINFIALVILFAAVTLMGQLGGSAMKLKITPSIWQCSYLIIMAASLNLVLGFLGQLSLGHCGFMAVGAYTAALISHRCTLDGLQQAVQAFAKDREHGVKCVMYNK